MATGMPCSYGDCTYTTISQVPDDTDCAVKLQLLLSHQDGCQARVGRAVAPATGVKAKMDAPKLQLGVDPQAWDQFMTR